MSFKNQTASAARIAVLMILVTLLVCHSAKARSYPQCVPCPNNVCVDVETCAHGITFDPCNNMVCARAPDERCGGPFNYYGTCGEGLTCNKCGFCEGCSVDTMKCSERRHTGCATK